MNDLIHETDCPNKTEETKDSGVIQLAYCLSCGRYETNPIECEHDFIPVAFVIANSNIQVRMYCRKCHYIKPNSESKAKFNMDILPKKNLDEYKAYYEEIKKQSLLLLKELTDKLSITNDKFRHENYEGYLLSPEWKRLRELVLIRDKGICQICGTKAMQVHHLTYQHIGNEFDFELVALCISCHYNHYHPEKIDDINGVIYPIPEDGNPF